MVAQSSGNSFFEFFGDEFWKQNYENKEWQQRQMREASGSGVILSQNGYIVTNNHVIDNAKSLFPFIMEEVTKQKLSAQILLLILLYLKLMNLNYLMQLFRTPIKFE
jgi:hypothetical protein